MTPAASHIEALGPMPKLIGTSGTIQALARLDRHLDGRSGGESHGWVIKTERLERIVSEIKSSCQNGDRIKSVSSDRSQTILAGSIVLLESLRCLNVDEIVVCSAALREGVVVDRFLQSGWLTGNLFSHRDPRSGSVHDLLERYHGSFEHAAQVARLATEVFLQTQGKLHNYTREHGHLLWAAGILHDIGMFVGRNGHHKHSHYLIKHSGLVGYSEEEVELIASIARYHRGSEPKESHEAFTSVPTSARQFVSQMASFLRIAEALDRSHRQIVTGLKVRVKEEVTGIGAPKEVNFELILPLNEDGAAEAWAFNEKKSLFEDQFNAFATIEARAGFAFAVN
jgi:exopolyphosphatase/guanosine-5'-triphosphate,3'-diphosphate pyrophosphatase